jgi:uncharacterized protein YciW
VSRRAPGERSPARNGARSSVGIAQRFTLSVHPVRPGSLNFPARIGAGRIDCYSTVSMEMIENKAMRAACRNGTGPALSLFERALAAYVAGTINDDADAIARLDQRLTELGAPRWLLDNVRRGRGRWTVCDDDRVDLIVGYAAKLVNAPDEVNAIDGERLRAVGLTAFDVVDLQHVVAYCKA